MSLAALWLAGSAAALAPTPVIATDSTAVAPPQVRATRLVRPIVIDGVLHDVMWEGAERVTGFLQRDPNEGMAPTESTFVYVAYDDAALYIGARLFDAHPDSIVARLGRRDAQTNSDAFTVYIDPYHDRRSGYYFAINAAGMLSHGQLYKDVWDNSSWDGGRVGKGSLDSRGRTEVLWL